MNKSEFDAYAEDYQVALERGVSVSGEDSSFLARERIEWLARRLQRQEFTAGCVLDFGCGIGAATPYFFQRLGATSVIGVDLSEQSLRVARRTHGHLPVQYSLTSDYQPDGTIDLAFCNGVFHHIPIDQRAQAVNYIASCLRPGGMFAFWENNPWSPAARLVMSRIPFDRDAVMVWPRQARTLVEQAGLSVVSTDFLFIFPGFLRMLRPIEPSLRGVPLGAQYQVLARKP